MTKFGKLNIPLKYKPKPIDDGIVHDGIFDSVILPNGVKDEIVGENYVKRVGGVVLNGSRSWSFIKKYTNNLMFRTNDITDIYKDPNANTSNRLVSNKFENKSYSDLNNNDIKGISLHPINSRIYINIPKQLLDGYNEDLDNTQTTNIFKQWLENNNTTVAYQLAVEELIPLQVFIKNYYEDSEYTIIPNNLKLQRYYCLQDNNSKSMYDYFTDKEYQIILDELQDRFYDRYLLFDDEEHLFRKLRKVNMYALPNLIRDFEIINGMNNFNIFKGGKSITNIVNDYLMTRNSNLKQADTPSSIKNDLLDYYTNFQQKDNSEDEYSSSSTNEVNEEKGILDVIKELNEVQDLVVNAFEKYYNSFIPIFSIVDFDD